MAFLGIIFALCGLAGVIWVLIIAIQNGDIVWGIVGLFCGIVAIIYAIQHFEEAKIPLGLMILGVIGNIIMRVVASG